MKTHILSQVSLKRLKKNPNFLNIKKTNVDSVFSFRKTTEEKSLKVI